MQCRETRELLSPYLDGVFSPTEEKAISTHLRACPNCRSEWLDYQEASEALKQLPETGPSPGFSSMVIKKIAASVPSIQKKPRGHSIFNVLTGSWSRAAAFIATMILTIGVSTLVYSTPGQWGLSSLFHPQASYVQGQGRQSGSPDVSKTESDGSSLANRITKGLSAQSESARPAPVEIADSGVQQGAKTFLKTGVGTSSEAIEHSPAGIAGDDSINREERLIEEIPTTQMDHRDNLVPLPVAASEKTPEATNKAGISYPTTANSIFITNKELPRIVRVATLSISTDDPGEARRQIRELAGNHGCLLLSEVNSGRIIMKIPRERYAEVIEALSLVGPVKFRQNVDRDVTGKYYYYEAGLLALQDEEARLSSYSMDSTDYQLIQERLFLVRDKIEAYNQMLTRLKKDTEFAALTINLE